MPAAIHRALPDGNIHRPEGVEAADRVHKLRTVIMDNGTPFLERPDAFRRLQGHLLKRQGGDREMAEILALVLQHDEQAVLCVVELALDAGVPTKTHILNILHRLTDGKTDTL